MHIEPLPGRYQVKDLGHELLISIPSAKNVFLTLFMGFWLVGWAVGEVSAVTALLNGSLNGSTLFLVAWLGVWTVGGAFALYGFIWQLVGKEKIVVSHEAVSISKDILGFTLPKIYASDHLKDLRVSPFTPQPFVLSWYRSNNIWGIGPGIVAFDYGSRTVNFGSGLDEAEAKEIIKLITNRFPQYLK